MMLPFRYLALNRSGVTMIELLVVVATLSLLLISGLFFVRPQINKGYDGRRKSDMQKIATALESYHNDKDGYPPTSGDPDPAGTAGMEECDTDTDGTTNTVLDNYMRAGVPCDARKKTAYVYLAFPAGCDQVTTKCRSYGLFTNLDNDADPDIKRVCGANSICYSDANGNYKYGVSGGILPDLVP